MMAQWAEARKHQAPDYCCINEPIGSFDQKVESEGILELFWNYDSGSAVKQKH